MEIENCNPVEGEEAGFGITFGGLLVDRRGEAGVPSGEAGLEGIFERDEIGDRKVTTELVGMSKPEGVRSWKPSSGSERTERQSSQGGNFECNAAFKKIQTNINRGNWCYGLVKLRRTNHWIHMLLLFLSIISHIM